MMRCRDSRQGAAIERLMPFMAVIMIAFIGGCSSQSKREKADEVRKTAIERLHEGKTYLYLDGIEDAIACYAETADTTSLLEMYQIASISMRWNDNRDSAASYLHKALEIASPTSTPSASDICFDLSRLYSHPLVEKDYVKAIEYARMAAETDTGVERRCRLLHDIGIYYAFLNRYDSASVYLERALDSIPKSSSYYDTFALNYAGLPSPDFHRAIQLLDGIDSGSLGQLITKGFLYLNHGRTDSAYAYLKQSQQLYDSAPERFSINTYNNLRLLSNCISYSTTGHVFPGEGTGKNDSISERISLNRRIDAERTEHNARLEIELLRSKSNSQRIWIVALVVLMTLLLVFGLVFWRNKRRYLRLYKEFDQLRRKQIMIESEESAHVDSRSMEIMVKRTEICIERFRESGIQDLIHKGEIAYDANESYLPVKDRSLIRQTLLECFSDFIIDLKMDAGKLTMDDIVTALLALMHVQNGAIAACLGVSAGAVRTRKTRLRARMSEEMAKFVFR